MTLEQKIDLLLERGITKTEFKSIQIDRNAIQGVPIGQGECKAVILKANILKTYTDTPQIVSRTGHFYYGDANQQTYEYMLNLNTVTAGINLNNLSSEIIFCNNLNEVWVRFPVNTGDETTIEIQIIVYN